MPSVDANLTIDDNGIARPLRVSDLAIQGKSVRHGAGAPTDASGTFDEFYIDTTAWTIYGPKTDAGWGIGTSLVGSVDLTPFQARSEKGQPNGYAGLDAGGKVATSALPPLAINDVFPVTDQAAMLALTAQRGDLAVRADTNKTYALAGDDATLLANWIELRTPGAVTSVNGQTGAVVLTSGGGLTPTAVKTANYTAAAGELVIADAATAPLIVTLPAPAAGRRVGVKRINAGANTVRLAPAGAEAIDGDTAGVTLTAPYTTVTVVSDGTNWYVD